MPLRFESGEMAAQRARIDLSYADVAEAPGERGKVTPVGFERGGRESALDRKVGEERVNGRVQIQMLPWRMAVRRLSSICCCRIRSRILCPLSVT